MAGCAARGPLNMGCVDLLRRPLHLITEPADQCAETDESEHVDEQDVLHSGIEVRRADQGRGMVCAEPPVGHVNNWHIEKGKNRQRCAKTDVDPAAEERRIIR